MPRTQLKAKARSLARQQKALELLIDGHTVAHIARTLKMSAFGVQKLLHRALETEGRYGTNLSPERIQEFRSEQCEKINRTWLSGMTTLAKLEERIGTDKERSFDATSHARMIDSLVRAAERVARLLGLDQPVKIIEQQLRVSYQKTDTKVLIEFDRSPIEALARVPVPGLEIKVGEALNSTVGEALNGQTPLPALDSSAVVLANGCTGGWRNKRAYKRF